MQHLTPQAKHLISRLSNNNLLGIIQNLAYCLNHQTTYFSPSSIKSEWLDHEISVLQPHQKLELIIDIIKHINL